MRQPERLTFLVSYAATREARMTKYRDIAAILRDEIMTGAYPRGATLPPEPELAERFGTTRATLNNVLRVLRTEGLISTRQGKGTFVTAMPRKIRRDAMTRYTKAAREQGGGRVRHRDQGARDDPAFPAHREPGRPTAGGRGDPRYAGR
ncbi:GntR family transcriptional regulator [Actinocorallia sp. API 0066]|uniref:GntR family transcriptional regulator n=1 Tax=Actinocorallia sp. API 0066 TaxID=2896846 RepID=UPI0035AB7BF8